MDVIRFVCGGDGKSTRWANELIMEPWQHRVSNILQDAEICFDGDDPHGALEYFREAFHLILEPRQQHPESTRVIAGLGDCFFLLGDYEKAKAAFDDVLLCPDGAANPFVRLRRGQSSFKLGDKLAAIVDLTCAYLNGGEEVFSNEDPIFLQLTLDNLGGKP